MLPTVVGVTIGVIVEVVGIIIEVIIVHATATFNPILRCGSEPNIV